MPYVDPEKKRANAKAYYEANREERIAQQIARDSLRRPEIAVYKKAYRRANRDKIYAQQKAWRDLNPEMVAAQNRSFKQENPESYYKGQYKKFGITLGDYDRMLDEQQGVCAICQTECSTGNRLAVDHCHETGEVRGLLCSNCNLGLGKLKDSVKSLQRAIDYLQRKDGPHRLHRQAL